VRHPCLLCQEEARAKEEGEARALAEAEHARQQSHRREKLEAHLAGLGELRGMPQLKWIRDRVLELAKDANLVVLEGYGFAPGRGNAARELGELGGVIRFALYEAKLRYVDVPPASCRRTSPRRAARPRSPPLPAPRT
jgi:hypothetical protein